MAPRCGALAFFVYGFAKNERQNSGADELAGFKKLASVMLAYDEDNLARALTEGALIEVVCDEEAIGLLRNKFAHLLQEPL